jgi:hypothetical protein
MTMNNICLSFVIKILNDKVPNISLQLNCTDGFKIHPYRAILEQKYKKGFGASVQIWMEVCVCVSMGELDKCDTSTT